MNNTKSKILFIGPTPPPYSGPELSMLQFLESKTLNSAFHIIFLKTNFRTDNTKKGKLDFFMIRNFFKFFFRLIKILISNKLQCVYYPITPTQIGWLGRDVWTILWSKLFGAKVIIHLRGSHFKLNFQQFNTITKKLVGYSLKQVDCAIVQANYLKDQFAPYLSEDKVRVLYQAMDINKYSKQFNDETEFGKILVMGHMTKAKGYTDILKIIPDICNKHPDVKFYFAGNMRKGERGVFFNQLTGKKIIYEDPFKAEKQIMDSKYQHNYVNLGIIEREEKMKHLRTAQIFLTASYSEGFSRSLLEAMSIGKPVAYTPVGAHREVFKDKIHGFKFEPGNVSQLKEVLLEMLSNPIELLNIGKTNRDYVTDNFSVEKITNDFRLIISNTLVK